MPLRHWLQLALTDGIGPILIRRIIDAAGGSVEAACDTSVTLLRNVEGIGGAKADKIARSLRAASDEADKEIERASRLGVSILCPDDERYPILLRSIPDPPCVLYMRGGLEPRDLNAIAIVGSRRCSYYGREQAERFAALLAGAGVTVISGGARGIDSAAHRGAMSHPQGRTIAVLGSGVDVAYPSENAALFDKIATGGAGAVLSEYPLGTPPLRDNFPRRNRIVSGMSRGVFVIEADERSGALITARQACDDHGRPVFALPGKVDHVMSVGPHQLIRDGAVLVTKLEDILEALGPLPAHATEPSDAFSLREKLGMKGDSEEVGLFSKGDASLSTLSSPFPLPEGEGEEGRPPPKEERSIAAMLTDQQCAILDRLDSEPRGVDVVIESTGLPAHVVLGELTLLCLKGFARRAEGQSFTRTRASIQA